VTPFAALFLVLSSAAATTPPDVLLVADKSDNTVRIVDARTGEERARIPVGKGAYELAVATREIQILADGSTAAISNPGTPEDPGRSVTLVDIDRGALLAIVDVDKGTQPHGLAALPDGRLLVTAERTRELLIVDPKRRWVDARIRMGREGYHQVIATPDGARAFVSSRRERIVTAVDLAPRRVYRDLFTGGVPTGMDVTPDGRQVWLANRNSRTISVLDAKDFGILATFPVTGYPDRIEITPNGKHALVSFIQSGELHVFDVAGRREFRRIPIYPEACVRETPRPRIARRGAPSGPALLLDVTIEPDGGHAWVTSTNTNVICRIDLAAFALTGGWAVGEQPDAIAGRFGRR
jgi:DNA-binding beta-propeller fold protein YncE